MTFHIQLNDEINREEKYQQLIPRKLTERERLKIVRKELRLTQREFAEELGCKQVTISSIERGDTFRVSNRIKTMLRIVFNVNIIWLERGVGTMFLKGESLFNRSDPNINRKKDRYILNLQKKNKQLLFDIEESRKEIIDLKNRIKDMELQRGK